MLNPDFIRTNKDSLKKSQIARGESPELVDEFIDLDDQWRKLNIELDDLRSQLKTISKEIGSLKTSQNISGNQSDLNTFTQKATAISDEIKSKDKLLEELKVGVNNVMLKFSNLVDENAPIGSEEDFKVIEQIGMIRDFLKEGFQPKDHVELGENLGMLDIERGSKVSGSRFYYLLNDGALLELALINFALDVAKEYGFNPVIPPALVKPQAMEGTGFLGQAAENVYRIEKDDLYLVGTSEVPLAAMHMDEIIDENILPLKYAGISPCFRREAGSYGKDTRGIFRVHWFDKVEMFIFCNPNDANKLHLELLEIEKTILKKLEIPFRVIDVASKDLGSSAARKFDCEAWIPSMNQFREVTSTSNCTEYQSRRLKIRYRSNNKTNYLSTLNGTLLAVTRIIIALLENHQNKDGTINIPKALQPYIKNQVKLLPQKFNKI